MTKKDMRAEVQAIIAVLVDTNLRLEHVLAEMHNRPRATSGEKTSATIDANKVKNVWWFRNKYPDMPQHEIAKHTGINQGRVSEILAGKRS